MARAAAGRHLLVWSADARESEAFAKAGITGELRGPAAEPLTFHVAVQDATGTKVDYFVRPSISVDVRVTPGGTALVRTTVSIANGAPMGAAPSYALGPNNASTSRPGQYVTRVYLWSPLEATQDAGVEESGLRLLQQPIVVEPGATGIVTFDTIIPDAVRDGALRLRFVPQPRHVAVPLVATVWAGDRRHPQQKTDLSESRTIVWKILKS
jgi:hypothetical protein